MTDLIRWFGEVSMADAAAVGAKNASLGEMFSNLGGLGVVVPDGFATTVDAYRMFMDESGLGERTAVRLDGIDADDPEALRSAGEDIRGWIAGAFLPDALVEQLGAAYHMMGAPLVAVRSSATAEDLPDASFAGMQDTYLGVQGVDRVVRGVRDVFASLYSDRAVAYRARLGYGGGGAAISVRGATGCPVKLVGTGERPEDLEVFHPERMASRILGMGDILTLVEKAEQAFEEQEAVEMAGRMLKAEFTFDDFLEQVKGLRRMGSFGELLGMIPGAGPVSADAEDIDREVRRFEAIICSMTPAERADPKVIDGSRRRRIAAGSGNSVQDVSGLLRQFGQMRKMVKALSQGRALPGLPGMPDVGLPAGLPRAAGAKRGGRRAGAAVKRPRTPKKLQKKKRKR